MSGDLDDVRGRLADLAGLSARQAADDDAIANAAALRLQEINRELDELAPRTASDKAAADSYQALVKERGLLHQAMARLGR